MSSTPPATTKNKTKSDIIVNVFSQAGIRLLSMFYVVYILGNVLGEKGLGQIALAFAIFEIANALTDLGCTGYILREVPKRWGISLSALKQVTIFRFVAGLFLYGVIAISAISSGLEKETVYTILILCLTLFLNCYNNSLKSIMVSLVWSRTCCYWFYHNAAGRIPGLCFCILRPACLLLHTCSCCLDCP